MQCIRNIWEIQYIKNISCYIATLLSLFEMVADFRVAEKESVAYAECSFQGVTDVQIKCWTKKRRNKLCPKMF